MITNNTSHAFLAKPLYITTPIFYPSGRPHIGHAYSLCSADVLSRLHRQGSPHPTWFVTGTDEHGEKLQRVAQRHGVTPQAWVDDIVAAAWTPLPGLLNVVPDVFIRTTEPRHVSTVQRFLEVLRERGFIYLGLHTGFYCVECEEKKTRSELVDGQGDLLGQHLCAIHKSPVEEIAEENYFFRLSAFAQPLLQLLEQNPEFVQPARARNEIFNWLHGGLEDLSISRTSFDWGVPLPWDTRHVVYVWFDALLNYLTAVGYDGAAAKVPAIYEDATHLIGRDILRFHAIVLPALLLAHGLALPRHILTHGWLLDRGEKVAKSSGNAVEPKDLVNIVGADAVRYYLLRTIPLGQDGGFSVKDLRQVYESDLANGYGNLASRLAALSVRHGGTIHAPGKDEADVSLLARCRTASIAVEAAAPAEVTRILLTEANDLIQAVNGYLTLQAPWQLAKDETQTARVHAILGTATHAFLHAARLLAAVLPATTVRVELAFGVELRSGLQLTDVTDARVTRLEPLFPRLIAE